MLEGSAVQKIDIIVQIFYYGSTTKRKDVNIYILLKSFNRFHNYKLKKTNKELKLYYC